VACTSDGDPTKEGGLEMTAEGPLDNEERGTHAKGKKSKGRGFPDNCCRPHGDITICGDVAAHDADHQDEVKGDGPQDVGDASWDGHEHDHDSNGRGSDGRAPSPPPLPPPPLPPRTRRTLGTGRKGECTRAEECSALKDTTR
jgi:hypothetical protein